MKKLMFVLLLLVSFAMLLAVESDPSAVVGYVKYPCLTGLNLLATPMEAGFVMASDLALAYPGTMDAINYWDAATQSWVAASYIADFDMWDGDFPIAAGSIVMVNALSPFDLYSLGSLPVSNASYSLLGGLNTIMVPLNYSSITLASELGASVGTLDAINAWDASTQSWVAASYIADFDMWDGDFALNIGFPVMVNSSADVTWPVRGRTSTSTFKTSNK